LTDKDIYIKDKITSDKDDIIFGKEHKEELEAGENILDLFISNIEY